MLSIVNWLIMFDDKESVNQEKFKLYKYLVCLLAAAKLDANSECKKYK